MRRVTYLFLALCLCLPIIGCGGDAATTTPAAPSTGDDGAADAGSGEKADGAGSEAKEEAAE